jgi:serine/threonine protein phosphatase PrpC
MCAVVIDEAGLLTCANIGDSRAVLCRAGRAVSFSFLFFYFISRFRKMFF